MSPVVHRELLVEARRPIAYWLRVATAGVFFVLLAMALREAGPPESACRKLFPFLHGLLLVVSLLVAPVLIVDGFARERRERTLELLLLTPLTPGTILLAKTLTVAARTLVLVLGALPVIAFTVLFGGVGAAELALLFLVQAIAVTVSLAVGLLAACWGRTWIRSLQLAGGLLVLGSAIVGGGLYTVFQHLIGGRFAPALWPSPTTPGEWLAGAARLVANDEGVWSRTLADIPRPLVDAWLWMFGAAWLSTVLLAVVLGVGARVLLRHGLRQAPAARAPEAEPSRPARRWTAVSARKRGRWLEDNPLRWLMRYRGEVRLARWMAALLMAAAQVVLARIHPNAGTWFVTEAALALGITAFLALAAAASFRTEREEGTWEMLLVTPLKPRQFLLGRLGGLWWQFGPVLIAWAVGLVLTFPGESRDAEAAALLVWVAALGLGLPAIGLEAAFQFRTYWKAAVITLSATVGTSGLVFWAGLQEEHPLPLGLVAAAAVAVIAGLCGPGFVLRLQLRRNGDNFRLRPGRRRRRRNRHGRGPSPALPTPWSQAPT